MDGFIKFVLLLLTVFISELQCLTTPGVGHFRCTWQTGPTRYNTTTPRYQRDQSKCSETDGSLLTSYINYCTKQKYVPLLACRDDGTWNCQSFIGMCKTLIHTNTGSSIKQVPAAASNLGSPDPGSSSTGIQRDSFSTGFTNEKPKVFSPDENYFTMKEMAVAVLVSFITGATVLAVVICVVWRCRHSHLNSEHFCNAAHQSAKRLAAIHAITHIAHAIGGGQDTLSTSKFSNPQYGQIIASGDILQDALAEHDRIYEEIFTRRKSSCNNSDCIYANVSKARKKNSVIRQSSLTGDLKKIDESAEESDYGYEADNNATPQAPRRPINYWGNVMPNVTGSPALNASRVNNSDMNSDLMRMPLSFRNCLSENSDETMVDIRDHYKVGTTKCDSGYNDELSETGLENVSIGENKNDNSEHSSQFCTGERKQSLRL